VHEEHIDVYKEHIYTYKEHLASTAKVLGHVTLCVWGTYICI